MAEEKKEKHRKHHDPLLDCLVLITQLNGRPVSRFALITGLPLVNGQLTSKLLLRAAERALYDAKIVKVPLQEVTEHALPAIALLRNHQACVITHINPDKTYSTITLDKKDKHIERHYTFPELALDYAGEIVMIQPSFEFSERSSELIQSKPYSWFWHEIKKVWPLYTETMVASFLINIFALAAPLFAMNVYDRVVPNQAVETLWVLVIGVTIVYLFDFAMRLLRSYFIDVAAKKVDINLSSNIFAQLMNLKMNVRPKSVGVLASTVHSFESFRDFITSTTINVLIDVPFAFIFIITIAMLAGKLALVPLIMMPISILSGYILHKPLSRAITDSYKYSSEKQATLLETLGNIETIKTTFSEGQMQHKWEHLMHLSTDLGVKLKLIHNINIYFSIFLQQATTVLIIIMGVYSIKNGDLTTGALIACTILGSRAVSYVTQTALLLSRYQETVTALETVDKLMQLPTDQAANKSQLYHPPVSGHIEFRDVKFSYGEHGSPSIKGISFNIKAGEHVGFIGKIGSGKSTIAKLMMALYYPTDGLILMDDTDIQQFNPADIRYHTGYVPQDISLVYGTIRDNIILGAPNVDPQRVFEVITLTGADEFIHNHPDGLDMQVGEGGRNLSGGQRQLIAISRSLLLDPHLLIFDEPSNAMDDRTENIFKKRLAEYIKGRTLILMTHKVQLLTLVDRLIVVDNGKIIADGTRNEIIAAIAQKKISVSKV